MVPSQLKAAIDAAERLVVKDAPLDDATTLFESNERKDLEDLRSALIIAPPEEYFHCMCIGAPAIYLYGTQDASVVLTNHHGQSVRCSLWNSDVPILDVETWLGWFDERGITGPRDEFDANRAMAAQGQLDWDRWQGAMPAAIRSIWPETVGQYGEVDVEPLARALQEAFPDEVDQILALLQWYGSGSGPWSGYPAYEAAAEEMLMEYETDALVAAVDSMPLAAAQTEGVARLFGGWQFSKQRPGDLAKVPPEMKRQLWIHVADTPDEHKLRRARAAFSQA